ALLLGVFQVSILHNIVHLLFGVWGLAAARSFSGSRVYLIGGGLIYGLLWIYGLVVDEGTTANFVPLHEAENWLHLGRFVLMVRLGVLLGSESRRPVAAPNGCHGPRPRRAVGGGRRPHPGARRERRRRQRQPGRRSTGRAVQPPAARRPASRH